MEGALSGSEVPGALIDSIMAALRRVEKERGKYPDSIIPIDVVISHLERAHPGIAFSPCPPDRAGHTTSIDVFTSMGSFRVKIRPE